jgi:hypothetical protein
MAQNKQRDIVVPSTLVPLHTKHTMISVISRDVHGATVRAELFLFSPVAYMKLAKKSGSTTEAAERTKWLRSGEINAGETEEDEDAGQMSGK